MTTVTKIHELCHSQSPPLAKHFTFAARFSNPDTLCSKQFKTKLKPNNGGKKMNTAMATLKSIENNIYII